MDNITIKCLKSEKLEGSEQYGQFLIDLLKPGQGITIGNLLRRILLGDLGGMAITAIRIGGIKDEFSIIPGVREDVLEILLNLKGVVIKSKTQDPKFGVLKVSGPTVITADLIKLPKDLEIINLQHYIATLSSSNSLEIEFKFEYGTGYKLASQPFCSDSEDFLQVDAIFMPVQKVDFKVDNIYDISDTVSERLYINIWTDGSMSPEVALTNAKNFAVHLFDSLKIEKVLTEHSELKLNNIEPYSNLAIEELKLSVRAYNCLKRAQINTVGDLLEYSPEKLRQLKNFGRKSADEVFLTLKNKLGIVLK